MKNSFEEMFLTIVQDGGTVTVGDKTFNVTLAEAAKESEKVPVGEIGKWYRYVGADRPAFTLYRWYECFGDTTKTAAFKNNKGCPDGFFGNNHQYFDLANPCPFDPQTLVGKTVKYNSIAYPLTIQGISADDTKYLYERDGKHEGDHDKIVNLFKAIEQGKAKVIEPEADLFVPESVEFVRALGRVYLKKDNYFLCDHIGGFLFGTAPQGVKISPVRPKLIPCLEKDVKVGEWMVKRGFSADAENYILRTSDGFVGFTDDVFQPISFGTLQTPEDEVYKVQF